VRTDEPASVRRGIGQAADATPISATILEAINRALTAFLERADWREASAEILRAALRVTGSEYGFVGVLVDGPALRVFAHEGIRWHASENRAFYDEAVRMYREVGYIEFTNFSNLFGAVLTSGRAVLTNDPATDPRAAGLPPGHPPLRSFLGVPFVQGGEVVGMIGVANRPGGYRTVERMEIEVLSRTAGAIYDSYRSQRYAAGLRQTKQLESLGVLAGGIAHDFNTLLTSVLNNASLTLMELPARSPARAAIETIEAAAVRAAELTGELLAYAGRGSLALRALDLSESVAEITHLLEASISKKAVLRFEFAPNLPAVWGDAAQLRQIAMNFITNASDALGEQCGTITVRTGVVYADRGYLAETSLHQELPEGPYAYLEVSDTGCGMDADTAARIFDPFFTTKVTGRGLGLAAVLGIVRGHRGAIKVESVPGLGTTFRVLLPAAGPAAAEHGPVAAPVVAEWRGAGTILVVDDEEFVRFAAKHTLEKAGFTVLVASDGREALALFAAHRDAIRAVVLDMTMPELSGDQALRELRRLDPAVRVIVSTAYGERYAAERFRDERPSAFLQKPYRAPALIAKVCETIGP
jgi:signal transduction histidine kinase/CheY-like chemotaxis protein